MRTQYSILLILSALIFFSSCENKTTKLLSKKWDCVKVENLNTDNTNFQNPKDSADAVQLRSVLESLTWTFKDDYRYECAIGSRITTVGSYGIMDDGITLICTPDTKNNVNRYTIQTLTEDGLILNGSAAGIPLILHFKPH